MIITEKDIWLWLEQVTDPEVPVLSILDLGIVRSVKVENTDNNQQKVKVMITITPTYSGCPAMDVIGMQIRMQLMSRGISHVIIEQQLQPAWTTDWMTENGKKKLEAYGIAAPRFRSKDLSTALFVEDTINCPKCGSNDTTQISNFGGTACKALYQCKGCLEPFEYFKCH